MLSDSNKVTVLRLLILALLGIFMTACGGGGGSNSAPGTLTLAITDASIDDYDEALLEISSITLIGSGGQETEVLPTPQTVDLLKLRNVSELLLRESLTARTISKIRLGVESITLNKVDPESGLVTETVSPPVPSRKVDLNPQGSLEIRAGEDLLVMLDVDLEKSIKVNDAGASEQVRFRPVVFITAEVSGLVRLYGTYTDDGSTTSICDLERISDADGIYEVLDMCVVLDETNANYFGADGLPLVDGDPASSGDLTDGNKVSVYGYYRQSDSGTTLAAEIIARGTGMRGEAFTTVNGIVADAWDPISRRFNLALTDATDIPVELSDGAKVFNVDGELVAETSLTTGTGAEARGAFTDSGNPVDPDWIQAFIAFSAGTQSNDSVSGTIADMGINDDVITLFEVDPMTPTCVVTSATTLFYSIETDAGVSESSEILLSDLADGDEVDASGDLVGDCLQATTVIREVTL